MQNLAEASKVLPVWLTRMQRLRADDRAAGAAAQLGLFEIGSPLPMKKLFARFIGDTAGVTAIEYGLIGALISVVCIAGMTLVGNGLTGLYAAISAAVIPALAQ